MFLVSSEWSVEKTFSSLNRLLNKFMRDDCLREIEIPKERENTCAFARALNSVWK